MDKEATERVPVVQPSFGAEDLQKSLEETKVNHCPYLIPGSRLLVSGMAGLYHRNRHRDRGFLFMLDLHEYTVYLSEICKP